MTRTYLKLHLFEDNVEQLIQVKKKSLKFSVSCLDHKPFATSGNKNI